MLVRLAVGTAGLGVGSATASAHDGAGHGGAPVAFAVVVGVPVVVGLLGGLLAARHRGRDPPGPDPAATGRDRASVGFGLLLVALGATAAVSALARAPVLGAVVGGVGALAALSVTGRGRSLGRGRGHHGRREQRGGDQRRGGHADLALGGVCVHRLLEGAALGALYTAGVAVGAVAVVVVAGHAALETAAVGGLYASRPLRALAAVGLVQAGYAAGAVAGVAAGASVPASVQTASLGLVAGVLLVVGLGQTARAPVAAGAGSVSEPRDRRHGR